MKKETILEFYNKYKLILFPSLVTIACLVLIVLVIFPQAKSLLEGQNNLAVSKTKLKSLEAKAQELDQINDQDLKNQVQLVLGILPEGKEPSNVFGVIQRVVGLSSVNLVSLGFTSSKGTAIGQANSFSLRAQVAGSKSSIGQFLTNLSEAPLAVNVTGISLSSASSSDLLAADIQIDVYFSPTPKTLGSAEDPLPELSEEEKAIVSRLAKSQIATPVSQSSTPTILLPRGKPNPFE